MPKNINNKDGIKNKSIANKEPISPSLQNKESSSKKKKSSLKRKETSPKELEPKRKETSSKESEPKRKETSAKEPKRKETSSKESEPKRKETSSKESEPKRKETSSKESEIKGKEKPNKVRRVASTNKLSSQVSADIEDIEDSSNTEIPTNNKVWKKLKESPEFKELNKLDESELKKKLHKKKIALNGKTEKRDLIERLLYGVPNSLPVTEKFLENLPTLSFLVMDVEDLAKEIKKYGNPDPDNNLDPECFSYWTDSELKAKLIEYELSIAGVKHDRLLRLQKYQKQQNILKYYFPDEDD